MTRPSNQIDTVASLIKPHKNDCPTGKDSKDRASLRGSGLEDPILESWREQVLHVISIRIAKFESPNECGTTITPDPSNTSSYSNRALIDLPYGPSRHHRAPDIPEILDLIISKTSTASHLAAWNVSRRWRTSTISVIESKPSAFWIPDPCGPVEYGQPMDPDSLLQLSLEERKVFQKKVTRSWTEIQYYPARFTQ